jgi:lipopolysaccharide biosynthesis glycosyltransferase
MFARLLLASLVDAQWIVYLDSDTFILGDFIQMFQEYITPRKLIYATQDWAANIREFQRYVKKLKLSVRTYFNSGVLIMRNLPILAIRLAEAFDYINTHRTLYQDQDALNSAFKPDEIFLLPKTFNCMYCRPITAEQAFVHHGKHVRLYDILFPQVDQIAVNPCRRRAARIASSVIR